MDPDYKYESDKDRRLVEDLSAFYKIPTIDEIPTPETDMLYNPENGWTGVVPIDHARDLERRLTIAREALKKLDNWLMRDAQRKQIIEQALTKTEPKQ